MQAAFAPVVSEREWQLSVVAAARRLGWTVWYQPDWVYRLVDADMRRRRRRDRDWPDKGFPDLWLVREAPDGRVRLVVAELKAQRGTVRPEQRAWLDRLGAVPGVEVHVWRPAMMDEVLAVLGG